MTFHYIDLYKQTFTRKCPVCGNTATSDRKDDTAFDSFQQMNIYIKVNKGIDVVKDEVSLLHIGIVPCASCRDVVALTVKEAIDKLVEQYWTEKEDEAANIRGS